MKQIVLLVASLVLWFSMADAQTLSRDALIDRIEITYWQTTVLTPDSLIFEMILTPAKMANPKVNSDSWLSIKNEVTPAITKVMVAKGGAFDLFFRKSVEKLSDEELDKLGQILNDPSYQKFQSAMMKTSSQQELMLGIMRDMMKLSDVINDNLAHHSLNQVPVKH